MKKITKKTTKKTVEPEIIMNCVTNTTPNQLYNEAINAKVRAGKPINVEELQFVKDVTVAETVDEVAGILAAEMAAIPHTSIEINGGEKLVLDAKGNYTVKKPNLFKRFWNWLRRK
jgi:hypothetical protein